MSKKLHNRWSGMALLCRPRKRCFCITYRFRDWRLTVKNTFTITIRTHLTQRSTTRWIKFIDFFKISSRLWTSKLHQFIINFKKISTKVSLTINWWSMEMFFVLHGVNSVKEMTKMSPLAPDEDRDLTNSQKIMLWRPSILHKILLFHWLHSSIVFSLIRHCGLFPKNKQPQ